MQPNIFCTVFKSRSKNIELWAICSDVQRNRYQDLESSSRIWLMCSDQNKGNLSSWTLPNGLCSPILQIKWLKPPNKWLDSFIVKLSHKIDFYSGRPLFWPLNLNNWSEFTNISCIMNPQSSILAPKINYKRMLLLKIVIHSHSPPPKKKMTHLCLGI